MNEIMLPELDNHDWMEAFGEGTGGNCTRDVESPDGTPCDEVSRANVRTVVAMVDGQNDGDSWAGVFVLRDGRFLAVSAGCDYTGWD